MPYVAALSEHPLAAHATGEVVGRVLEELTGPVDVAVLVVSGSHGRQFEQIADTVRSTLTPGALIGATTFALLSGEREVEDHPAVALWAGSDIEATAVRLDVVPGAGGATVVGLPEAEAERAAMLVVIGADGSFPADDALRSLAHRFDHLEVVGGLVSAGARRGDTQLLHDGSFHATGAVGLLVRSDPEPSVVVSPACRPIGRPFVVTRAAGAVIEELGGRPVLDRLDDALLTLDDDERGSARRALHLGRVIDEHRIDFGPGDFDLGRVTSVDRDARSIVVAEAIEVGATVQFQVRDAIAADQDLRARLSHLRGAGALVFAASGRGSRLFAEPDHDAGLVSAIIDRQACIGVFCTRVLASCAPAAVDHPEALVAAVLGGR